MNTDQSQPFIFFRQLSCEPGSSVQKQHEQAQVDLFNWLQDMFGMPNTLAQFVSARYASCHSYVLPQKVANLRFLQEQNPGSMQALLMCLKGGCTNEGLPALSTEKRAEIFEFLLSKMPELSIIQREPFMNDAENSIPTQMGLYHGLTYLLSECHSESLKYPWRLSP